MNGRFIDNLPRVYGLYTGGFIVFIGLMAVLEQMGVSADTLGILFVAFTIAIYAGIGWLSRTMQVDAYYVAGREVPALYNGMATAADWMSGASFVAMAGGVYFGGYGYLALSSAGRAVMCWLILCWRLIYENSVATPCPISSARAMAAMWPVCLRSSFWWLLRSPM